MTAQFQFFQSLPHKKANFVKKSRPNMGYQPLPELEIRNIASTDIQCFCKIQCSSAESIHWLISNSPILQTSFWQTSPAASEPALKHLLLAPELEQCN